MSEPYPLPAHAASIWAVEDQIFVCFPATVGEKAHTVPFPNTERGIGALRAVLLQRAKNSHLSIGNKGTPCRAEIEDAIANDENYKAWLKSMEMDKHERAKEKAEATKFLEEIGL